MTRIVESMILLMETGMVDGEEANTLSSEYVQASCLVTSGTESMSFDAGEAAYLYFQQHTANKKYITTQLHSFCIWDPNIPPTAFLYFK